MSLFRKFWDGIEHDAKPLLSAAGEFAETDGLAIVRQVRGEMADAGPGGLVDLFNRFVAPSLGLSPSAALLTSDAIDLLATVMARRIAAKQFGGQLRVSVLNAGIEQAVLLAKGQSGDVHATPDPTTTVLHL